MVRQNEIKILGSVVPCGGSLWMMSSLSEISFTAEGATYLQIRLRADGTTGHPETDYLRPRYAVYLDGKMILDARMAAEEEKVEVFRDGNGEKRTVRLVKLSECTQSAMALEAIVTDGKTVPLPDRPLKIEFIGDSITCGYGVEGTPGEPFSTATENASQSYAGLTAEAMGADARLSCYSGHGIVSAYTDDPSVRNTDGLVPQYYEKAGRRYGWRFPDGRLPEEIDRDFSAWQPGYIVINLGTNDLSWCANDPEKKALFRREYARFLKTVRRNNPGARILCVLGLMGTGLNREMEQAAEDYRRETGDPDVRTLTVEEQDMERDGAGTDFHPSAKTQRLFAATVTEALRKWITE